MNNDKNTETGIPYGKNRWKILLIVVLSIFMSTLDGSIVNVALPSIAEDLNVTSSAVALVVSVYLITVSSAMLLFGRLGDIWGKSKIFQAGLAVFTVGSMLCGMTRSFFPLLAARVIQAIGAAGIMANSQGIVTQVFPADERGRALGLCGTFVALGSLVGPALGGIIVEYARWEYIFRINIPIGVAVFLLSIKIFPKISERQPDKLDLPGAVLFIFSIVLLFAALGNIQNTGISLPVIAGLAASAGLFAVFLHVERRAQVPLLDLALFRNKWFTVSIICSFISFAAIFCSNIVLPFYLQYVLEFNPGRAGLFMSIYPLVLSLVAPVSGYISDRKGSEVLTLIGLSAISFGLLLMSTLNEHPSLTAMGLFISIMAVGNGMFQSPNTSLIMSALPRNKLGIGGGITAFARNLGMISGITLATSLLYGSMSSKIGYHVDDYVYGRPDVFVFGMRIVFLSAAAICVLGSVITAFRLISMKKEKGHGTVSLFQK